MVFIIKWLGWFGLCRREKYCGLLIILDLSLGLVGVRT